MNNKILGILIFFSLLIITINKFNIVTFGLILLIIIFLILKKEYKLILVNIILTIIIFMSLNLNKKSIDCDFSKNFKVHEVYQNYCIIKQDNNKFLIYQDDYVLNEGNIIKIDGILKEITPNGIPYLFSFKEYLENKKIYYQIDYSNIEIINSNVTFQNKIINKLLNKINYSKDYINLLLFNSKSDSIESLYNDLIDISAIQLFVISGFHITFLKKTIDKVSSKLIKKKENYFTILILLFYVYLLKFSISSLRAFLSIVINKFNKYFKLNLSTLDINSLIAIIFLIINPKNLFLVGFQLSFIIVIFICILSSLKNNKILMIVIPFLISLPIIINMNGRIGIVNFLMNFILTPIVSVIYLLGIITIIIPYFDKFLFFIIFGFESVISFISKYNVYLNFPYLNLIGIIIFYIIIYNIILYLYLKNRNKTTFNIVLLNIFLISWYYKPISNPYIIFLDVGQGDACLIHGSNNKYNILIDTGGSIYNDIATKKLIPYFEKVGIKKLDLVIISHLDYDHYGALESLNKNFKINKIIQDNNYENIYYNDINFKNLNQFYNNKMKKIKKVVFYYLNL